MPALAEKKKILQSLRDLHKPLDHDELQSFRDKQDKEVEDKTKGLIKQRIDKYDAHRKSYNYKEMASQFTNAIKEHDFEQVEKMKMKEEEKVKMMQKAKSYGDMVKTQFKPKISKKKQLEMQLLKENLANPVRKRFQGGAQTQRQQAETDEDKPKRKKIIWKENPMRPSTPPRRECKVVDYLKEAQIKKAEQTLD